MKEGGSGKKNIVILIVWKTVWSSWFKETGLRYWS